MDLWQFFYENFIRPMDERSGYNAINTPIYAAIAIAAAVVIYIVLRKLKVRVDEQFVGATIPFVLFGSTLRVVVDANILPYSYLTVTPGIYVVVGLTTIAAVLLFHRLGLMAHLWKLGTALWLLVLLPLLPLFKNFDFFTFILLLALIGAAAGNVLFTQLRLKCRWQNLLAVFSHALDGAATFVSIDIFSRMMGIQYFEQHVVTNVISQVFGGFWAFYFIKLIFSIGAVWLIDSDKGIGDNERNYIVLLLIIFGLAPGVRDALRLLCGV